MNTRGIMGSREQLIDLIIHDLTGPLSVISSTVTNLLKKEELYGPLADRQRKGLERILRNSRKAQTLLQEMLEIARSEGGVFQAAPFPVEQAIREAFLDVLEDAGITGLQDLRRAPGWDEFQRAIEAHGFLVEVTGRYARDPFFHDWRKVRQVMRNLLSNGLKFRRSLVKVSVTGKRDLFFSVEDDGLGILKGDVDAIFDRFVRLAGKGRPEVPGLGLGLAGVKALVQAMGGDIVVVSTEGRGSRFTVRIPPLPSEGGKEGAMRSSVLDEKRILAVDDEPDVLMVLEEEIKDSCPSCAVDKATTFETAAEMLSGWTYDLVILDIMGVRGFDLLERALGRNFPVAMLTAHALSPEALKRSFEMGARAYLPKEKLGEIVPFLEDVLTHEYLPGWKRLMEKLKGFFDQRFESGWEKKAGMDWKE